MTRIISDGKGGYEEVTVTGTSVDILGVNYTVKFQSENEDYRLKELDGYTDFYSKLIVIEVSRAGTLHNINEYHKKVLRHEIVHAFLYESGLGTNSHSCQAFADDEEIVDWIAIQGNKIHKAWEGVNAI